MAAAYVQAQKIDTSGTTGGITITLTAGNAAYVWVRAGGTVTINSVADTLGNTYSVVTRDGTNNWPLSPDADADTVALYQAVNVTGGATTITVTTSASATQRHIAIEFSGLTTTTAVDKAALTDSQTSTTPTSGVTATRTQAAEMLLSCISTGGSSPGYTAGTNFTKALAETTKSAVEHQVVAATGTDAGTWTLGAGDVGGNFTIVTMTTLKAAGALPASLTRSLSASTAANSGANSDEMDQVRHAVRHPLYAGEARRGRSRSIG
jgi:hypothetical protein